ncbi:MAG: 6-carboxytetrahydropterin synthase [Alphaproteobacteria bacterium]|nr:6-carboxytetrahydropterin synthase [Alphaproteobacteria bacterium]
MKLFVEHLTTIDSAYLHPEHGMLGESWMVDVILDGLLDDQSMVMDFSDVKKALKNAIDDSIDHTLIVPQYSHQLVLDNHKDHLALRWNFGQSEWLEHRSPHEAVTLLKSEAVTHEAMISFLKDTLAPLVPKGVEGIEITLRHETTQDPTYHYVHGLKKHGGNCQRIAHGHRSRIQILRNDVRAHDLEKAWAKDWFCAYIGTQDDIAQTENGMTEFAYRAQQGSFTLAYPTARCRIIDSDSTVECIASYIAQTLKKQDPSARFTVRAYEGVQKGAIAQA